jgi:vacuolar-type H+-ATPase subunit D/Vma8
MKEHEVLKKERQELMDDTMALLNYNDELTESKDKLEGDLVGLRDKFEIILKNLKELGELEASLQRMHDDSQSTISTQATESNE